MAMPAGMLASKLGYKGGIIAGLLMVAVGGFWFLPATHINSLAHAGSVSPVTAFVGYLAGVCAIAAGVWNLGKGNSWLVSLHGLALGAFGLIGISPLVKGPLGFRPISLLFVLMALSLGAFALGNARTRRNRSPYGLFIGVCGVTSLLFACSFVAVGFGWIRIASPFFYWYWMSSYFGFTALCMLSIAVSQHSTGLSETRGGLHAPVRR